MVKNNVELIHDRSLLKASGIFIPLDVNRNNKKFIHQETDQIKSHHKRKTNLNKIDLTVSKLTSKSNTLHNLEDIPLDDALDVLRIVNHYKNRKNNKGNSKSVNQTWWK